MAMDLYNQGQFDEALARASQLHPRSPASQQPRLALLAGMSAAQLKRKSTAEFWLRPLVESSDREIAGRASASLGLAEARKQDYKGAAVDLSRAGRLLKGSNASRANFFAGECYTQLGQHDTARLMYRLARAGTKNLNEQRSADVRLAGSNFVVQLGAFHDRAGAEATAQRAQERSMRMGLGEPRIVETTDLTDGLLYIVRLGSFPTEAQADAARVRMGKDAVVVASVEE